MNKKNISRNNFISIFVEGGFYFTGYTFFDVYVVIPVFVEALTGNLKFTGLAAALKLSLYMVPQLIMGLYTAGIKNVPRFLGWSGFLGRVCSFIVPLTLVLNLDASIKVLAVYFALSAASFADGLTHVPWLDILGRTIEPSKRGKLLGYQQLTGGLGGFAAGICIKTILAGNGSFESKYASVFFIGAVIITISGLLLFTLKDIEREIKTCKDRVWDYFKSLHKYLFSNKSYLRLIATQIPANFSGLAAPLYILFAKTRFDLPNDTVSTLMFIQILGGLAGGVLWGNLSYKKGNKFTIQTGLVVNIITVSNALMLQLYDFHNPFPFTVVMVFSAGLLLGAWLGYTNYLLDIISDEQRPVYIAITSTILFPLTFTSLVGGVLADKAGFSPVFGIVAVFVIIAFIMSFKLEKT